MATIHEFTSMAVRMQALRRSQLDQSEHHELNMGAEMGEGFFHVDIGDRMHLAAVIQHEAYGLVSDHVYSKLETRGICIRPNGCGDAERFHQRQREAEPRYQFWTVLLAAAIHATALPLTVDDITKGIADLNNA